MEEIPTKVTKTSSQLTEEEKIKISIGIDGVLEEVFFSLQKLEKRNFSGFSPDFIKPSSLDYATRAEDKTLTDVGPYILNPEVRGIDYEKSRIFIPDLSHLKGRPHYEVFQYVVDTYSEQYYIPDLEYIWKWLIDNQDKIDQVAPELKADNCKYSFICCGSVFRDGRNMGWSTPRISWEEGKLWRGSRSLGDTFLGKERIILIKKD